MKNSKLFQKKILFICPAFNTYEQEIIKEMQRRGADAHYIEDDFVSKRYRFINKISKKLLSKKIDLYWKSKQEEIKEIEYDFVFVIKGGELTLNFLDNVKRRNNKAKFILYLWDSITNNRNILNLLDFFDKVYSFDDQDCKKYNFLFRPTFYLEEERGNDLTTVYDLLFVGAYHSDRYNILKKITADLPSEIEIKFILFTGKLSYLFNRYITKKIESNNKINFIFKRIDLSEVMILEEKSEVILDIHHNNQSGLTQRAFNCLIKEKKLITTNSSIYKYDFYNPNNIMIVNRGVIKIDSSFFHGQYKKIDKKIIKKYSIEAWLSELFSNKKIGKVK
jgi:hypothetical protein